jgi:hypothetical protein
MVAIPPQVDLNDGHPSGHTSFHSPNIIGNQPDEEMLLEGQSSDHTYTNEPKFYSPKQSSGDY